MKLRTDEPSDTRNVKRCHESIYIFMKARALMHNVPLRRPWSFQVA